MESSVSINPLALRYLAHSRVQTWIKAQNNENEIEEEEWKHLQAQAEYALEKFGPDLERRNGWACEITGQKNPTFDKISEISGRSDGKSMYHHASLHIHSNHRSLDELLGMCEAQEEVFLVGPSNSGMVAPLTLSAMSITEITSLLILMKPNFDRLILINALFRMAQRMNGLASSIERKTFKAAKKRRDST